MLRKIGDITALGLCFFLQYFRSQQFFSFGPTLYSAFLSALVWNYLFIPPKFTFHISFSDDVMMLISFFVVAVICGYYSSTLQKQKIIIEIERLKYVSQLQESIILKESEKLHQTLLNSVSHELRTPLTSIIGSSSALLSGALIDEKTKVFVDDIHSSALRLQDLTQELLDMSRLSAGVLKPKFDYFELNDFIHQVLSKYEIGKKCSVQFKGFDGDIFISGDEALLEVCFFNILKNAIKYTISSEGVEVSTSVENQEAIIKFKDFGPGIDPAEVEKLFIPFYRAKESTNNNQQNGLGLGLSIAKSIIDLHNGNIILENSKNTRGAEIIIRLPQIEDVRMEMV